MRFLMYMLIIASSGLSYKMIIDIAHQYCDMIRQSSETVRFIDLINMNIILYFIFALLFAIGSAFISRLLKQSSDHALYIKRYYYLSCVFSATAYLLSCIMLYKVSYKYYDYMWSLSQDHYKIHPSAAYLHMIPFILPIITLVVFASTYNKRARHTIIFDPLIFFKTFFHVLFFQ